MNESMMFARLRGQVAQQFPSSKPPAPVQACHGQTLAQWRAAHKADIEEALKQQRLMLLKKRQELLDWDQSAQVKFMTAFGVANGNDASRVAMADRIDRELALNSQMTVDNFVPGDPGRDDYAYVYPDDKTHIIHLDQDFWDAPMTGTDSKAGTLSHEMSHFDDIGGTRDKFLDYNSNHKVYGVADSLGLSSARPDLVMKHADSFEYWCEDAYSH